jgi:hypothetical protein
VSLSGHELRLILALDPESSIHQIRSRVARVATGRAEFGSSPSRRAALFAALKLSAGASDIAALRVVESILRPHPLRYRTARNLHLGVVDARGAGTLGELARLAPTVGDLAGISPTLGGLAAAIEAQRNPASKERLEK